MTTDEMIRAFLGLGSPFIADGSQAAGLPRRIAQRLSGYGASLK